MNQLSRQLKSFLLLNILCFFVAGCAPLLPTATPAPSVYDIGVPMALTHTSTTKDIANRDIVVISEAQVDGVENSLGIVYRYTNTLDYEPKQYRNARWSQHPAEMLRFRMLQHLGEKYPVVLGADFIDKSSWMLRFTLEEFSHHLSSDTQSSGVVQIRVTLGQGGSFVGQKTFRVEVEAPSVDVQGGVSAISRATDETLLQIANWVDENIQMRSNSVATSK